MVCHPPPARDGLSSQPPRGSRAVLTAGPPPFSRWATSSGEGGDLASTSEWKTRSPDQQKRADGLPGPSLDPVPEPADDVFGGHHRTSLENRRSAKTLPSVWQVGQYVISCPDRTSSRRIVCEAHPCRGARQWCRARPWCVRLGGEARPAPSWCAARGRRPGGARRGRCPGGSPARSRRPPARASIPGSPHPAHRG